MNHRIFLVGVAFAAALGCSPEHESKMLKGIEAYRQGAIEEGTLRAAEGLVLSSKIAKFKKGEPVASGNVIYTRSDNTVRLHHPCAASIVVPAQFKQLACDPATGRIAATNGLELRIFGKGGASESSVVVSQDKKDKADSLAVSDDAVFYFVGRQLHRYSIADRKIAVVAGRDKIQPPFIGVPYYSHLYKSGTTMMVILGIAGDYTANIVDLAADSLFMKDIKVNSPRMWFENNRLWYVSGIIGMWQLVELSVPDKKKREVFKFRDIADVAFFPGGMLYEDREGLWAVLTGPRHLVKLPAQLKIAGMAHGAMLLTLEHATYLVDSTRLAAAIAFLAEKGPGMCAVKKF